MLFMFGGPSHLDTFDPKPLLARDSGRPLPSEQRPRVRLVSQSHGQPRGLAVRISSSTGRAGCWISSLFPNLAQRADDLCVINSMHCSNSRHGGAVLEWHTGSDTFVRPSMGSWITYGLGSENQNFPGYVTICQDLSQGGANNFGSGFLPAAYQGTTLGYAGEKPREARIPFIGDGTARRDLQRLELDLIASMDRRQADEPRARDRARRADRVVRAGLPAANRSSRDAGRSRASRRPRSSSTVSTIPRRPTSARSACWRGGSRSEAFGSSSATWAAGTAHNNLKADARPAGPRHRQADRRAC